MWIGFYYIIIVVAAVWAVITGFRRGFMRQTGSLLATAFAVVAARLLAPEIIPAIDGWLPPFVSGFNRPFICQTLAAGAIFFAVYGLISLCVWPLNRLIGLLGYGVLNSIAGAVFKLFVSLLFLSILYNLLVDLDPKSDLTRSSSRHDGNLTEAVMKIAPPILGFTGAEEVAYRQQLEDAKKIS